MEQNINITDTMYTSVKKTCSLVWQVDSWPLHQMVQNSKVTHPADRL